MIETRFIVFESMSINDESSFCLIFFKEVDDDLLCDICLQPFVDPYDTRCGHTFCCVCLKNYVRLKKICPVDRKNLNFL